MNFKNRATAFLAPGRRPGRRRPSGPRTSGDALVHVSVSSLGLSRRAEAPTHTQRTYGAARLAADPGGDDGCAVGRAVRLVRGCGTRHPIAIAGLPQQQGEYFADGGFAGARL